MNDVSLGLAHEFELRIRKAGGTGQNFFDPVSKSDDLASKLVALVVAMITPVFRLITGFDHDKTKDNWELLSDTESKGGEFTHELVAFFKEEDRDYINGDEMVKRTEHENNGGQRAAEAMLRDQDKIPAAWRKYFLVFPKTLWRDPCGGRDVACLYFGDGRWHLSFLWLEDDFDRYYRVVRLGKYQK